MEHGLTVWFLKLRKVPNQIGGFFVRDFMLVIKLIAKQRIEQQSRREGISVAA